MPSGHLVAFHHLTFLGDVDAHQHIDAGVEFVGGQAQQFAVFQIAHGRIGPLAEVIDALVARPLILEAAEHLDIHHAPAVAVRHAQRHVARLLRLFAEDGDDQALFRRQFALAFRRDLADQNVFRTHLRADPDDALLVQVFEHILADIGDVAGDLFRPQLGIARLLVELLDMD